MTPLKFTDEGGNLILVVKEEITRVMHYYDHTVPPDPPSTLASCIVLQDGSGVYAQESVEKVYEIIKEAV